MKWLSFSRQQQSFANVDTYDQASRGAWGSFILIKRQFTGERFPFVATNMSLPPRTKRNLI